jgi:hypothetical protein
MKYEGPLNMLLGIGYVYYCGTYACLGRRNTVKKCAQQINIFIEMLSKVEENFKL